MKVSPRTKEVYRKSMHSLTKNVGQVKIPKNGNPIHPEAVKSVLVIRPNHRLGNQLLIIPVVEELMACFPNAKIDLFLKGNLGPILFKHFPAVNQIFKLPRKPLKSLFSYIGVWFGLKKRKYDVVFNVEKNSSSGRLAAQFARGRYKFFEITAERLAQQNEIFQRDFIHNAKAPILSLREHLADLGFDRREEPLPLMRLRLNEDEQQRGKEQLAKIADPTQKTICLFTYATRDKIYTEEWWKSFYEQLKEAYPTCNIVEMLPAEKVSQIDFAAPHYYSRDILEMTGFLAATDVFIGADSGIMHLASASGVATLGLFKVTKTLKYEPYGPGSKPIDTTQTSIAQLVKEVAAYIA